MVSFSVSARPRGKGWLRLFRLEASSLAACLRVLSIGVLATLLPAMHANSMLAPGKTEVADPTVDESSGAATMRIPIEVPPGPGGLEPRLELRYSSQGGDGIYGVGWDLALGEIRCSDRFGVPDYESFESCPAYELDGKLLTGPTRVGPGDVRVFHGLIESFERIEYSPVADSWTVIRADGRRLLFGRDPMSRVSAGGVTARWLLSEIRTPYYDAGLRNSISYEYAQDTSGPGGSGTRYPVRIAYADGTREVIFEYETRSDPIHDYRGGIERRVSKRVREVQVISAGALFHRIVLVYDTSGHSTGRSRLTSIQRFGIDCPNLAQDPLVSCTGKGLPPVVLSYAESTPANVRWDEETSWDSPYPLIGNPYSFAGVTAENVFGDINGDGLPDLIHDDGQAPYLPGAPESLPLIMLNNGRTGFETPEWLDASGNVSSLGGTPLNDSAEWTNRLRSLTYLTPQITAIQTESSDVLGYNPTQSSYIPHLGVCDLATLDWVTDHVKTGVSDVGQTPPGFVVTRNAHLTPNALNETRVRLSGNFRVVDIDADGSADLVLSMRLTGLHKTLASCASPESLPLGSETWTDGATLRVAFRNTRDMATGWEAAPDLATDLPIFGVIATESPEYVVRRMQSPNSVQGNGDPCLSWGLGGQRAVRPPSTPPEAWTVDRDFCINNRGLNPSFVDLNGDDYLDLIVEATSDDDALFFEPSGAMGDGNDPPSGRWRYGRTSTEAWIQNVRGDPGSSRWVRAPQFDPPIARHTVMHVVGEHPGSLPYTAGDRTGMANNTNVDRAVQYVDLNRDGLTDIIWTDYWGSESTGRLSMFDPSVSVGVLLNRGRANASPDQFSAWCGSSPLTEAPNVPVCADAQDYLAPGAVSFVIGNQGAYPWNTVSGLVDIADINGDGWPDLVSVTGTYLQDPGASPRWLRSPKYDLPVLVGYYCLGASCSARLTGRILMDLDGNGIPDILASGGCQCGTASGSRIARFEPIDLLTRYENGRGGTVHLAYQSPIVQRDDSPTGLEALALEHADITEPDATSHTGFARWSSRPVLASLRMDGPNRPDSSATANRPAIETSYRFARPRYCLEHRSGLGYRMSRLTNPDGSRVDSYFYQEHAIAGNLSERIVWDELDRASHFLKETWKLVPPETVRGAWRGDASLAEAVFVGRRTKRIERNEYGSTPGVIGESIGAQIEKRFYYDDAHGYNFISLIHEIRPSGSTLTFRSPTSDADYGIFGLPFSVFVLGADYRLMRRSTTYYESEAGVSTRGLVGRVREFSRAREPGGPQGHWVTTRYEYDEYGNRIREITEGPRDGDPDRVTRFCYDGDSIPGCPEGHRSHSLLVGTQDPLGNWATTHPHPILPRTIRTESEYRDEPTAEFEFDAFGRVVREFVYDGWDVSGARTLMEETEFDDFALPAPIRETRRFSDSTGTDFVWDSVVEDGFEGVWKTISDVDGGRFRGNAVYLDPRNSSNRQTFDIACGLDKSCTDLVGLENPATVMIRDELGRVEQIEKPDGLSLFHFGSAGAVGAELDSIFEKNAKGDLTRRIFDRDRIVAVEECANASDETLTNLESVGCLTPDRTEYRYEATGEVSIIHDARAVATGDYVNPAHRLVYRYDTLGRIIAIEDPNAGVSTTEYDDAGNVMRTIDARGLVRSHFYDPLDRPSRIETPMGEEDVTYAYSSRQKQVLDIQTPTTHKVHAYDGLGRLTMLIRNVNGTVMKSGFAYDMLGRERKIFHPVSTGGVRTAIGYEYVGGYLKSVCDLGRAASCTQAEQSILREASYDDVGQLISFEIPGGTRSFEYDAATRRKTRDHLESGPDSAYYVDFLYKDAPGPNGNAYYDPLGNLLRVVASSSEATPTFGSTYDYDNRNRLAHWNPDGAGAVSYSYDELGNLVDYRGQLQKYSLLRPNAIQTRGVGAETIRYDYDASGNLTSMRGESSDRYYRYDSSNRLVCAGPNAGGCQTLRVLYAGDGERLREDSDGTYYWAGPNFKYKPGASFADRESWVEIFAFGERIATKRIFQGALAGSGGSILEIPTRVWPGLASAALVILILGVGGRRSAVCLVRHPLPSALAILLSVQLAFPSTGMAWRFFAIPGTSAYRWVMSDAVGSGLVEVDESGDRIRHVVYAPFGEPIADEGTDLSGRRIYAGHERQEATGLVYMQARWYDPGNGRFLSVDPAVRSAGEPQSYNGYSYVENNPLLLNDPSGSIAQAPLGFLIGTTAGIATEIALHGGYTPGAFTRVAVAGLAGAVTGGLSAFFPGLTSTLIANGLAAGLGNSVVRAGSGLSPVDAVQTPISVAGGLTFSLVSSLVTGGGVRAGLAPAAAEVLGGIAGTEASLPFSVLGMSSDSNSGSDPDSGSSPAASGDTGGASAGSSGGSRPRATPGLSILSDPIESSRQGPYIIPPSDSWIPNPGRPSPPSAGGLGGERFRYSETPLY